MWSLFSSQKIDNTALESDNAEAAGVVEWVQANISQQEGVVDLVSEAEAALIECDHKVERRGNDLYLAENDLTLSPRGLQINQTGGTVRTASIVRVSHKLLPAGLFEFQHGIGSSLREALQFALRPWAQIDVPVLMDATLAKPQMCMSMTMEPKEKGKLSSRRIIFGPTLHWAQNSDAEPATLTAAETASADQDHSFCPCCLFMNSHQAFQALLESGETFALRLYAARDEEGNAIADCRINGEDFEDGKNALRAYVQKWPQQGFEFRKQYVVIQSCED